MKMNHEDFMVHGSTNYALAWGLVHYFASTKPGQKKLKAWLIDRKVPRERRDALVLVTSGPTVLAVPELGVRAREAGRDGAGLVVRIEEGGEGGRPAKRGRGCYKGE